LPEPPDRQRIDRWLWHARIVRTREAAAALIGAGHVRLNGSRMAAPGRAVRCGDVITIALDGGVRVLKIAGFAERRGPGGSGRALYQDLAEKPARRTGGPPDEASDADSALGGSRL
jgi:ribosome-associated heat shock protein Hsp15